MKTVTTTPTPPAPAPLTEEEATRQLLADAAALRAGGTPAGIAIAEVIEQALATADRVQGHKKTGAG